MAGGACARVAASKGSLDHRVELTFPAADISSFPELRFWIRSDRRANGSETFPFYWRMSLASAALSFDAPANTWRRLIPVFQANVWEAVRLSVSEVPAQIRTGLNGVRLECIDSSVPFTCHLDDLRAVRPQLIRDAEAALTEALDLKISFSGTPVPAAVVNADGPAPPGAPCLLIRPYDIQRATERDAGVSMPGEFTETGMRFWPAPTPFYLFYEVEARGLNPLQRAALTELVLDRFVPVGTVMVNGTPSSVEIVLAPPVDPRPAELVARTPLRLRLLTALQKGPETRAAVRPYKEVRIDADFPAVGASK